MREPDGNLHPHTAGFPHWATWAQRNTRFSADVAAFLGGAHGMASPIATRWVLG